ncbi:MAG: S24 family peptidase [Hyphomicrobiales bacterium]
MALTHQQIWTAVDKLAARHQLTASGLAKRAGLDSTAFNASKRITANGRERWPGTETLSRILEVTGTSFEQFANLAMHQDFRSSALSSVPLIGLAQAGSGGYFDDMGLPAGAGWEEISFPGIKDDNTYALEISGDSMAPLFRDGDIVIVAPNAELRRGDRVVARTNEGEVLAKTLQRQTNDTVELSSINPDHDTRIFKREELDWMARILWVSQ